MKKILYGLTLLAAMASCTESFDDWALPQSQEPEAAKSVTFSVAPASAIDYANVASDDQAVQLFVPSVSAEAGAETTLKAVLWNADKTASQELTPDAAGKTTAAELKAVVEALYGKAPVERAIAIDVTALTAVDENQTIANTGATTLSVTLVAPFIDTAYYLVGDMCGWSKGDALAFTHIGGADVYDNPEFQIVFKTTADNQYWKIASGTGYDADDIWKKGDKGIVGVAVDGDDSLEGDLITVAEDAADPGAGKIAEAGIYRMTINMMNYTYKLEKLNFAEYIYEIGNSHGWSQSMPLFGANFDGKYQGYYYLDGGFKFKPNADNWDGDWGQDPNGADGTLVQEGEKDCNASAGFYQIDVDLAAMTYSLTEVTSISIIGDFNGWGDDVDMTYNTADGCWEATTTVSDGGLKFRMNHDWAVSWGGANGDGSAFDNLTQNGGANLWVAAGTYKFQLYISYEGNNKVVVTAQ